MSDIADEFERLLGQAALKLWPDLPRDALHHSSGFSRKSVANAIAAWASALQDTVDISVARGGVVGVGSTRPS